jgi:hypothetical protein
MVALFEIFLMVTKTVFPKSWSPTWSVTYGRTVKEDGLGHENRMGWAVSFPNRACRQSAGRQKTNKKAIVGLYDRRKRRNRNMGFTASIAWSIEPKSAKSPRVLLKNDLKAA